MWLISHATGIIGRAVCRAALERGRPVRVLVHEPTMVGTLGASVEAVVADLGNTAEHKRAFADVEAALITAPLGPQFTEWHRVLAEAAQAARVRRVVQISAQGADLNSPMRMFRWLGDAEAQAAMAGVHANVLRPALYMQVLLKEMKGFCSCGVIEAPLRTARVPLVDARDVAEVAVQLFERDTKPGVHELTGPQAFDYAEIARVVSKVSGRRVDYVDVCAPKARGALEAKGLPPRLIEALLEMWDFMSAGAVTPRVTDEIEKILGRPPRKFIDFLKDHRAVFGGCGYERSKAELV